MMRFYKQITNSNELIALQTEAQKVGKNALGVSASGALYKYDTLQKRVVNTNESEAAVILETTIENVRKIIDSRGSYEIIDEIELVEELPDILETEEEWIEENIDVVKCNCDELLEENNRLRKDYERLTDEVRTLNDENTKLLFANVELENKAKKEPPITLEAAIKFVKENGYELKIK